MERAATNRWQANIDARLESRLARRARQPALIPMTLAPRVLARVEQIRARLRLIARGRVPASRAATPPIVHAWWTGAAPPTVFAAADTRAIAGPADALVSVGAAVRGDVLLAAGATTMPPPATPSSLPMTAVSAGDEPPYARGVDPRSAASASWPTSVTQARVHTRLEPLPAGPVAVVVARAGKARAAAGGQSTTSGHPVAGSPCAPAGGTTASSWRERSFEPSGDSATGAIGGAAIGMLPAPTPYVAGDGASSRLARARAVTVAAHGAPARRAPAEVARLAHPRSAATIPSAATPANAATPAHAATLLAGAPASQAATRPRVQPNGVGVGGVRSQPGALPLADTVALPPSLPLPHTAPLPTVDTAQPTPQTVSVPRPFAPSTQAHASMLRSNVALPSHDLVAVPPQPLQIDLDRLADEVQGRLARRLARERERKGGLR